MYNSYNLNDIILHQIKQKAFFFLHLTESSSDIFSATLFQWMITEEFYFCDYWLQHMSAVIHLNIKRIFVMEFVSEYPLKIKSIIIEQ
jgi:hypothetical protein